MLSAQCSAVNVLAYKLNSRNSADFHGLSNAAGLARRPFIRRAMARENKIRLCPERLHQTGQVSTHVGSARLVIPSAPERRPRSFPLSSRAGSRAAQALRLTTACFSRAYRNRFAYDSFAWQSPFIASASSW